MTSPTRCTGDGRWRGGLAWPLPFVVALLLASVVGGALLVPARPALAAPVASQDLTIYAGPGAEFEPLSYAPAGSAISVDGDAVNGFVPVSHNGVSGWAAEWAVSFDGAGSEAPPAEAWDDPAAATGEWVDPAGTGEWVDPTAAVEPVAADPALAEAVPAAPVPAEPVPDTAPADGNGDWGGTTATGEGAIVEMIYAAAAQYGQDPEAMLRVARCESNLDPNAVNGPGDTHGLFQFLPSTWAGTPYGHHSIYDPWANAHAAAWMWSEGRRNEWVCQ